MPTIKTPYIETHGITLFLQTLQLPSEFMNPSFHLSQMTSANTSNTEAIPTMEITTIHTDHEPSIHVEHFFDIHELKKVGLKLNKILLFCGVRHFLMHLKPSTQN